MNQQDRQPYSFTRGGKKEAHDSVSDRITDGKDPENGPAPFDSEPALH